MLYRMAFSLDLIRGRPINIVAGAILFIINRKYSLAKTIDDYAAVFGVSKKELGRAYRTLKRRLRVKLPPIPPDTFVDRYCNELQLNPLVIAATRELIFICHNKELLDGKSPSGITGACIYITSNIMGQERTQREISEVCNITEVTIRNRYKQISGDLGIEMDGNRVSTSNNVKDWITR